MKNNCCWVNSKLSYYLEPGSRIGDTVKVVLFNLCNQEILEHATGVDLSDSTAKIFFLFWKLKLIN